jgi:hypothetical protein
MLSVAAPACGGLHCAWVSGAVALGVPLVAGEVMGIRESAGAQRVCGRGHRSSTRLC